MDSQDNSVVEDELLTVQEAAELLKVPPSWIYDHVRPHSTDRLPVLKVGKYLRFDVRDLREYIERKRQASARPAHGR